ncbi:MAG: biotin--[acetyl-CoA-carboxylase] ligase [Desulforegulaceae bacterium]|nr:biotin--[acetyl-CoA-carboxylase] ligase [Desulforegulaceae bacterium]
MYKSKGQILVPGLLNKEFCPPDTKFTGFKFKSGNNLWSKVKNSSVPWDIYSVNQCESTMDSLFYLIEKEKKKDFSSLIAMSQNKGRGQYKKKWYSPKGNLSVSIHLPFIFNNQWSENYLPLIFGNLLTEALSDFGIITQIKWPNDIFFKGKKLGGILVEKKRNFYLAGIGMNLVSIPGDDELEDEFSIKPGSLLEEGININSPLIFWDFVLEHFYSFFDKRLAKESPSDLINSLIRKLAWLDEEVFLDDPYTGIKKYILKGLSEEGGLLLYDGRTTKVVYSGRIRPVNN